MYISDEKIFWLYTEKLSGNLSPFDEKDVEKMLLENEAFRKVWHSLEEKFSTLKGDEFLSKIDVSGDLNKVKQKIANGKKRKRSYPSLKLAAIAAIFLAVIANSYFGFLINKKVVDKKEIAAIVNKDKPLVTLLTANGQTLKLDTDSSAKTIALVNATINTGKGVLKYSSEDTTQNTLSVPEGENYKIILSDGTEVWLNSATSLYFPFHFFGEQREVYIEGEAFFKVAKDARHPFIVHTPLTEVQVLGTSFNINTYRSGNVQTALVEGKVYTKSNKGEYTELKPGFAADYNTKHGFISGSFEEDEVLSWMKGVYYFHNIPIADLAAMASRCYGVKIVLDKNSFSGISLTGVLNRNNLTDFLDDLQTTANIKYYYSGNSLYLNSR